MSGGFRVHTFDGVNAFMFSLSGRVGPSSPLFPARWRPSKSVTTFGAAILNEDILILELELTWGGSLKILPRNPSLQPHRRHSEG